ncbi:MAG: IS1380 family transposase [Chloroflexota bacterium]|nr:IS1380 family transposase [Chloroflexota bacterium]
MVELFDDSFIVGDSPVPDSATNSIRFDTRATVALDAAFDGGRLTSDGGLPWLSEADRGLGLCAAIAACVPEWRKGRVIHSLEDLVRQQVYQIACGYEDQDDADSLRTDPLLKLVCGRLPESGADLASQPTVSRLENAPVARDCYRMALALGEIYIRERSRGGVPERILLDIDGTDDPTHADQEGTAYHGYYRRHMYHPLLVFDGETDQLITAVLRPGNAHASRGAVAVLKQVVRRLRDAWPGVGIQIRADGGFAVPAVYEYCEAQGITYTIGLVPNARLEALAAGLAERAVRESEARGGAKVRLVSEGEYEAGSWGAARRVVYKAEAQRVKRPGRSARTLANTRFVVTARHDEPEALYDWYVDRGGAEGWVKDYKNSLKSDRLSCHRFWANQFRLILHAAAYWLLDTPRRRLVAAGIERMQLDTLRLQLVKIGGRVRQLATCVKLHLASSHPAQHLWHTLATAPTYQTMNNSG